LQWLVVWPSGKAVDCKSSIPSSNLGAALNNLNYNLVFKLNYDYYMFRVVQPLSLGLGVWWNW
jgi:hypothetical protein